MSSSHKTDWRLLGAEATVIGFTVTWPFIVYGVAIGASQIHPLADVPAVITIIICMVGICDWLAHRKPPRAE